MTSDRSGRGVAVALDALDFEYWPCCELDSCQDGNPTADYRSSGTLWCGCRHDTLVCSRCAQRLSEVFELEGILFCDMCSSMTRGKTSDWMALVALRMKD